MSLILAILGFLKAFAPMVAIGLVAVTQKQAGVTAAAAKLDAAAVVTEAAVAQAEADAPTTQAAVVDRLKAGTF